MGETGNLDTKRTRTSIENLIPISLMYPKTHVNVYKHLCQCIYSWFPLFMVVMLYKVATNTDLVNTEPLLLGEVQS